MEDNINLKQSSDFTCKWYEQNGKAKSLYRETTGYVIVQKVTKNMIQSITLNPISKYTPNSALA